MDVTRINHDDARLPHGLSLWLKGEPVWALGRAEMLAQVKIGLLCSVKCPGNIIVQTYETVRHLRDREVVMAGGFHSPMEKECLAILKRGEVPVVVCPAREIVSMRCPAAWRDGLKDGRLLVLSPFPPANKRMTTDLAVRRNEFVALLCPKLLVPHATPDGKLEGLVKHRLGAGGVVITFDDPANAHIVGMGAQIASVESLASW